MAEGLQALGASLVAVLAAPEGGSSRLADFGRGVLGLPADWSTRGYEIDRLLLVIHAVMLCLAVGWLLYLIYAVMKYRARNDDAVERAEVPPPRGRVALGLAFLVFLIELFLLVGVELPLWARRHADAPPDAFTVRVIGEQFAWNFHYPGDDGEFGATSIEAIDAFNPIGLDFDDPSAADDLFTINEMHLPAGRTVRLLLSSKDVVHGFYLPFFRVKQDAIPGQVFEVTFTPTRTGVSEIGCAQLCGLGHYRMRGVLTIEEPDDFLAWYEDEQAYM